MKKAARILCALLASVLSAAALSACGQSTDGPSSSADAASGAVSGETAPADGQPLKFSLAAQRLDAQPPVQEVEMVKTILSKAPNVQIEWIDWPSSAVAEKKSLAFASGDYPDAIMGAWVTDTNEVVDYAGQGLFAPIDAYITKENMPYFSRLLEARPSWTGELTIPDGHIYALPSLAEVGLRDMNDTMSINTEWLEKVGKEIPTTTDELFDVLTAFKQAGDLNGNGKDDEIPMILRYGDHMRGIFSIMGFFGNAGSQSGFTVRDGKVLYNAAQPEYKEAVRYLNKLYSAGLIDPECFTVTSAAYVAKANSKDPICGVQINWGNVSSNDAIGREVFKMIPPVRASADVEPVWQRRVMPLNSNLCFVVTDKAKDPAGILHFIDLFYEKDTSIQNYNGLYDMHLKKVTDNTFEWILNDKGLEPTFEETYPYVLRNRGIWGILKEDFDWATPPNSFVEAEEATKIYGPYIEKEYYPSGAWSTVDEANEATIIVTDLGEYVKNTTAKWISEGGIDAEWDSYLKKLDSLQLARYTEIKQLAYDRFMENE